MRLRRDNGLQTIDEQSELNGADLLVSANSKDLGARHSGIDVHVCTSATCEECRLAQNAVIFLPLSGSKRGVCVPARRPLSDDDFIVDDETGSV